ncbi:GNAT family N-acetyltransferase [Gymnodinialimonas ulvae]|uniref:GNAT family N-acetyltransferase n=1 Tax=Gymnodinialimonas ulvae TaxID=3126504 RepID=UPI00309E22EB
MTKSFDIRPLGRRDRPDWGVLWRGYLTFYDADIDPSHDDVLFERLLDTNRANMQGWIAADADGLIGLVHIIVHAHTWRAADVTYLQDLFALPRARGTGVGRALIETVYADADASGRPIVYWMTQTTNTTARTLYDRVAQPTDFMKYSRA